MKRYWLLVVGMLLGGVAAGSAAGYVAAVASRDHFAANNSETPLTDVNQSPDAVKVEKRPRVQVVNGELYRFGTMGRGTKGSHVFYIRNIGNAPLTLEKGDTTCKCTLSDMKNGELAPGETVAVKLEWTVKTDEHLFSQAATILTNDPERPTLELNIAGYVEDTIKLIPSEVMFLNVMGNEPQQREVRVLGARAEDKVAIEEFELMQRQTADFFDLQVRDLTAEELAEYPQARGGQMLLVTLKPGLPTGEIHQTIRLKVNIPGAPDFFVPIEGNVLSDVSVLGRGGAFDPRTNLLKIGGVEYGKGAKADLLVLVKGENRDKITLEVAGVDPASAMRVTLGEPRVNEKLTTYPLTVEILPDAPRVTRLGSEQGKLGTFTIRAHNALTKEVPVYVKFSIN